MSESASTSAEQAAGEPGSETLSLGDLKRVAQAVGIENIPESELTQLQLDLTSRARSEGVPAEQVLEKAITDFAARQASKKEVTPPPNPLKPDPKYDSGLLGRFTLDDARAMATNLGLKELKDEALEDFLQVAKREAGKGQHVGRSEQDLMLDLLKDLALAPGKKDPFKSVRLSD